MWQCDKISCAEFAGVNEESANNFDKSGCENAKGKIIDNQFVSDVTDGNVCCIYPKSA